MASEETRSEAVASRLPRKKWRRIIGWTLATPPIIIALICLFLAYEIYASNRLMAQHSRFPIMAQPAPPQSILVFSPHCDDETLGAAGLIQRARKQGCDVHVTFFTNGDGFRIGVSQEFAEINVQPADFVRYGYLRQRETRTALKVLGVADDNITFLGYPDRGLMPMWTDSWLPANVYKSPYTQCDHCPYNDAATPNAAYCGLSVLKDVEAQMERIQPSDIYVTHPNDDHPDHAAASVFVRAALEHLRSTGRPWAKRARLHYFLVHRGDWPVPQGLHEDASLPPPAQLVDTGTKWEQMPLSRHEIQRKYAAIKRYKSQTELTGRFLYSFVRKNELFGDVDAEIGRSIPTIPVDHERLTVDAKSWTGISPVALDPAADSVPRMMRAGADIVRMFAAKQGQDLFVRADMSGGILKGGQYRIVVRPMLASLTAPRPTTVTLTAGTDNKVLRVDGIPNATASWQDNTVLFRIPWDALGIPNGAAGDLYLQADTKLADVQVDRTGFRAVPLNATVMASADRGR